MKNDIRDEEMHKLSRRVVMTSIVQCKIHYTVFLFCPKGENIGLSNDIFNY